MSLCLITYNVAFIIGLDRSADTLEAVNTVGKLPNTILLCTLCIRMLIAEALPMSIDSNQSIPRQTFCHINTHQLVPCIYCTFHFELHVDVSPRCIILCHNKLWYFCITNVTYLTIMYVYDYNSLQNTNSLYHLLGTVTFENSIGNLNQMKTHIPAAGKTYASVPP